MGNRLGRLLASPLTILATLISSLILIPACPARTPEPAPRFTPDQIAAIRSDPDWPEPGSIIVKPHDYTKTRITIRDPLDPDNPYLADYGDWDLWCYRNIVDRDGEAYLEFQVHGLQDGWLFAYVEIDPNGWMYPLVRSRLWEVQSWLGYYTLDPFPGGVTGHITCLGPVDNATGAGLAAALAPVIAPYHLPVPDWIAADPPAVMLHLPDGRFALLGGLGSASDQTPCLVLSEDVFLEGLAWSVYSADGKLELTGEPGEYWWQVFHPDFMEKHGYDPADLICIVYNGWISGWTPDKKGYICDIYWDGAVPEPLESGDGWSTYASLDPRLCFYLSGSMIAPVHKVQQESGLIEPCGWGIGTADPSELDLTKPIAQGEGWGCGTIYIEVKSLDDPSNPYRDYYGQWDREYFGTHSRLCAEFGANNWLLEDDLRASEILFTRNAEITAEFGNVDTLLPSYWVDDDGYLIPLVLFREHYRCKTFTNAPAIISYISEHSTTEAWLDVMCVEDQHLEIARYDALDIAMAKYLPEIPVWLISTDADDVIIMENGDFLVGKLINSPFVTPQGTSSFRLDIQWFRFRSSGEYLGQTEPGADWQSLYIADYRQILEGFGGRSEAFSRVVNGCIEFRSRDAAYEELLACYTLEGEKIERAPYDVSRLDYYDVKRCSNLPAMRRAQLELKDEAP